MRGKRKNGSDIDLGLAILSCISNQGERRSQSEIAAFCGCSRQRIEQIEAKALRKLRTRLRITCKDNGQLYNELMNELFNRRREAHPKPATSGCY